MTQPSQKYQASFGISPPKPAVTAKALDLALDIRKFEIGLYWQRTAYFWALIAAAFAGFFAVLSAEHMTDKAFNAFALACIGFLFSVAWFLVNRGSKFWQENWENHVDMLEDEIAGPLYKTILRRPKAEAFVEKWIDGPAPISVSKINQWVSLFTILIWVVLAASVVFPLNASAPVSIKHLIILALTLVFAVLLATVTRSHLGDHKHSRIVKRTVVIDEGDV